jgi:hypothetical protein
MKSHHISGIAILLVLLLAATLVVSAFHQPSVPVTDLGAVAVQNKVLPAQIDTDLSEIGSTSGILIMGVVIVLIISAPLILRKKRQ